jgi:adenylate cyclase
MTDSENTHFRETVDQLAQTAKQLTHADRSALWVVDPRNHELWAPMLLSNGSWQDVRLEAGQGYVGSVLTTGERLNIPFDLYDDAASALTQNNDRKTGYRTCSLLFVPTYSSTQEIIGIIQLVNKSRDGQFPAYNPADWPQAPDCFHASFDRQDEKAILELTIEIRRLFKDVQGG